MLNESTNLELSEEQERALRDYDRAKNEIRGAVTSKPPLSIKQKYENDYGRATQTLVKLGLASPIKKKYRKTY